MEDAPPPSCITAMIMSLLTDVRVAVLSRARLEESRAKPDVHPVTTLNVCFMTNSVPSILQPDISKFA